MNKDCLPLRYEEGQLKLLASSENGELKALPDAPNAPDTGDGAGKKGEGAVEDVVEDAAIVGQEKKAG